MQGLTIIWLTKPDTPCFLRRHKPGAVRDLHWKMTKELVVTNGAVKCVIKRDLCVVKFLGGLGSVIDYLCDFITTKHEV